MFNYSEPQNISSLINFLKVSKGGGNVFSSVIEPTLACPLCLQVPSALPLMAPVASCFFSGIGVVGDGDAIHLVSIFQHPIRSCSNSRRGASGAPCHKGHLSGHFEDTRKRTLCYILRSSFAEQETLHLPVWEPGRIRRHTRSKGPWFSTSHNGHGVQDPVLSSHPPPEVTRCLSCHPPHKVTWGPSRRGDPVSKPQFYLPTHWVSRLEEFETVTQSS